MTEGREVYVELAVRHHFVSVTVKTTEVFGPEAHSFLLELG